MDERENLKCLRCGGGMEEGFILDKAGDMGNYFKTGTWAAGKPQTSFWSGLKVGRQLQIKSFRCTVCGHLENFA